MLTETGSIKTYLEHLTILPIIDLGIGRIRKLLCWPEENEPSHLATYLPCFYEHITFSVGVAIPFFQVFQENLTKQISSLYTYLRDNGKEPTSFLTYDEVFDFFTLEWILQYQRLWNRNVQHQSLSHYWSRTRSLCSAAT